MDKKCQDDMRLLEPLDVLNCRGRLLDLSTPIIMGILNLTPDSFHTNYGKHKPTDKTVLGSVEKMVASGATIIDIGGMSSRPGARLLAQSTERKRLSPFIKKIRKEFPETYLSIDAFRHDVVKYALDVGVDMVNDIYGGRYDKRLVDLAVDYEVPYICMHMQGDPHNMQDNPSYDDITLAVVDYFVERLRYFRERGLYDVILDPGFGFGKTIAHNYQLLSELDALGIFELPLLAGISRKSMIYKTLNTSSWDDQVLIGTAALHMQCLQHGVKILRVHDVPEAASIIRLWKQLGISTVRC